MYPCGFYGGVRRMLGAEASLVVCADDPELVEEINQHLCHMWLVLYERVFEETRVDEIATWEDTAGRLGSPVSPAMERPISRVRRRARRADLRGRPRS